MKKTLLTMAAALALVSCSQDDLMQGIENRPTGAIGVKAFVPTITRGTALDSEADLITAGNGFDLYAFLDDNSQFMGSTDGNGVAFENTTGAWDYKDKTEMRFWSEAGGKGVTFYGVSPMNEKTTSLTLTKNITATEQTLDYTVPTTCSEQVDLMYAVTEEYATGDETADHVKNGITLQFRHALSQIVFKAKTESELVYADVESVTIKNLYGTGQFNMATAETYRTAEDKTTVTFPWDFTDQEATSGFAAQITEKKTDINTDTDGNTSVSTGQDITTATAAAIDLTTKSEALLLLPQNLETNGAVLEISCKVRYKRSDTDIANIFPTSGNDEYATITVPVTTSWQPGYKYIYTLIFSAETGTPIKVQTLSVDEWNEQTEIEVPVEEQTTITPEADGTFKIYNAAQLADARDKINGGATYSTTSTTATRSENGGLSYAEATYYLMADIDLSAYDNWEPIGNNANPFRGVFEGGNHKISGLNIAYTTTASSDDEAGSDNKIGLFGSLDSGNSVAINDLTVDGTIYVAVTTTDATNSNSICAGIIAGELNAEMTMKNCHATGSITHMVTTNEHTFYLGGLAGFGYSGKFIACSNAASITSENTQTATGKGVGGITGASNAETEIIACYNTGTIFGEMTNAGGLVGDCNGVTIQASYINVSSLPSTAGLIAGTANENTANENYEYTIAGVYYNAVGSITSEIATNTANVVPTDCGTAAETAGTDVVAWTTARDNMNNALYDLYAVAQDSKYSWKFVGEGTTASPLTVEAGLAEYVYPAMSGKGTAEDPYLIYSAAQLATVANNVNNNGDKRPDFGETCWEDASYKLMKDIDLSTVCSEKLGTSWTPIGNNSNEFSGSFDGNYKTIKNLYYNSTTQSGIGIIGYAGYDVTIKNLNVEGSLTASSLIGGVVAEIATGTIENCTFKGTITGTSNNTFIGGVIGHVSSRVNVINCHTKKGSSITGVNYAGGVVGHSGSGNVVGCSNAATVSITKDTAGGVIGGSNFASGAYIVGCHNSGNVTGQITVGGILASGGSSKIIGCYNEGNVTGTSDYIGGIVGNNVNQTSNSAYGTVMISCYNTGTISSTYAIYGSPRNGCRILTSNYYGISDSKQEGIEGISAFDASDYSAAVTAMNEAIKTYIDDTDDTNLWYQAKLALPTDKEYITTWKYTTNDATSTAPLRLKNETLGINL